MSQRALIIEKDEAAASQLANTLIGRGFEIEICSEGGEAVDRARDQRPEVIVLCVELGSTTSGYTVCKTLKKDQDLQSIPVVITSADASAKTFDHHRQLRFRAQMYVKKPYEVIKLVSDIEALLRGDAVDDQAFDDALASLSSQPPPLPDDLEAMVGLRNDGELDEQDEVRTTIGQLPTEAPPVVSSGTMDLSHEDLVRRLKEAERSRDEATVRARAVEAELRSLSESTSQLPAAAGASSRESVQLKKELNEKGRELLELKDALQNKDRDLLGFKEREAELEEKLVQLEESSAKAEQGRIEAESKIAGAEARADEIERSSRQTIEDLESQLDGERDKIRSLETDLGHLEQELTQGASDLAAERELVAAKEDDLRRRDSRIAELDAELQSAKTELESTKLDLERTRAALTERSSELEQLEQAKAAVESELSSARADCEDLRNQLHASSRTLEDVRAELESQSSQLQDVEAQLLGARTRMSADQDVRIKAKQALEITLNLLDQAEEDYVAEGHTMMEPGESLGSSPNL